MARNHGMNNVLRPEPPAASQDHPNGLEELALEVDTEALESSEAPWAETIEYILRKRPETWQRLAEL